MKHTLGKLFTTAAVAGLGLTLPSANAALLSFSAATMTDGGTIIGSFDYTAGTFSSINVTTTAGSAVGNTQTYTSVSGQGASTVTFTGTSSAGAGWTPMLYIEIVAPTIPAAGPATWVAFESGLITSATLKVSVSPFLVTSNESLTDPNAGTQLRGVSGGVIIPEPSTYAMIAGLGMVAFAAYRRMGSKA